MSKLVEGLFVLSAAIGLALGILWGLWHLWLFVVPQVWPSGPETLTRPNYWLFAAGWTLVGFLGTTIFGRASK